MASRANIVPINCTIPDERQRWARHYGVHPYFTRRSASVVQKYVERYSREGDVVLDPFGGSGVTAIEAFLMGRAAIQNDLNPFANFLAAAIADTRLASLAPLEAGFARVAEKCRETVARLQTAADGEVTACLATLPLPENIVLPRNSDAERFHDLFTPRQLAALAILKSAIVEEREEPVRMALLLAWSAAASKLNRTFISAKGRAESRGGSSIFSIYRYKLAKTVVELPLWETFAGRYRNVLSAKKEVLAVCDQFQRSSASHRKLDSERDFRVLTEDAATLVKSLGRGSVDYIFTDPPYGAFIAYLDLSTLWNHWLGFSVGQAAKKAEIIVGGDLALTEDHYKKRLAASIRACVELLRPDRWLSVVFQHWDISYFQTILFAATGAGAMLKAAVTQEREVVWSMHKKKNAENMLAGEMILTFYKPARTSHVGQVREAGERAFSELLDEILQGESAVELTSQYLFNKMILLAWEHQSLSQLAVTRQDFIAALIERGWRYDERKHAWRRGDRSDELQLD